MAEIYTQRIFLGALPSAWTDIYTNSGTSSVVIRDVVVHNGEATNAVRIQISVQSPGGASAYLLDLPELAPLTSSHLELRVALAPADQVWVNGGGASSSAIITAYVFE